MIKLTFDTNCIINLLDYNSESTTSVDELSEILRYGLESNVNIAITTRVDSDISKDKNQNRKDEILKRIFMFPIIGTVARLDTSKLNSGDVLTSEENKALESEIKKIVFPNLQKDDSHYENKLNDIDHLIGHKINQRDIFITDDRQILKKAETLELSVGIKVMNPKKALEYINLHANKVPLVQEFSEKFGEYKILVLKAINGHINTNELDRYEKLRKWMILKFPAIRDGLFNFKLEMISIPTGKTMVFRQNDLLSLHIFNNKLNKILEERDPFKIHKIASINQHDYLSYESEREKLNTTTTLLNSVEDGLLGYLGSLESQ